jgi:hypothetical protein
VREDFANFLDAVQNLVSVDDLAALRLHAATEQRPVPSSVCLVARSAQRARVEQAQAPGCRQEKTSRFVRRQYASPIFQNV